LPVSVSPSSVTIDVVTPPSITSTVPNQPVAAGGSLSPFSTVGITDNDFNQKAQDIANITVSDGLFTSPTDKDGLLTGSGLSQSSPGTYSIGNAVSPSILQSELHNLTFTSSDNFYGVRKASITLSVQDVPPTGVTPGGWWFYPLTSTDYTTSVRETGKPISLTGLQAAQNVTGENTIKPFASATINDDSTNAFVTVSIPAGAFGLEEPGAASASPLKVRTCRLGRGLGARQRHGLHPDKTRLVDFRPRRAGFVARLLGSTVRYAARRDQ
jgi:hypothetical protein